MYNSMSYLVCCNKICNESGNIRKNISKCSNCRKSLHTLNIKILNTYFCPKGNICVDLNCNMIHPTKKHTSPPFISPCKYGCVCPAKAECIYLHPNSNGQWLMG